MSVKHRTWFAVLTLTVLTALGCNPVGESDSNPVSATSALGNGAGERHKHMAEMLARFGVDVDESEALFTIGWRNRRGDDESDPFGHAMAVAFGEASESGRRPGIDMGTVLLSASQGQSELVKREGHRGGVHYTSGRPRGEGAVSIAFVGDGTYEFEVSGSDNVAAVQLAVVAPAELVDITSHERGDAISGEEDLIIEWQGGAEGMIAITAAAISGEPRKGFGDGHGRRGGRHHRRHGGPKPENVMHEMLDSNSGQYTLTAEALAELIGDTGATRLAIHVLQLVPSGADLGDGTVWAVLRTGDGVMLELQ